MSHKVMMKSGWDHLPTNICKMIIIRSKSVVNDKHHAMTVAHHTLQDIILLSVILFGYR